jgi:hypothetical protein
VPPIQGHNLKRLDDLVTTSGIRDCRLLFPIFTSTRCPTGYTAHYAPFQLGFPLELRYGRIRRKSLRLIAVGPTIVMGGRCVEGTRLHGGPKRSGGLPVLPSFTG